MRVSQVAFDRFVVELPPADDDYLPLADPEEVGQLARWLWDFGRTPILALVGGDPSWCQKLSARRVPWVPADAEDGGDITWQPDAGSLAVVLNDLGGLRRFLAECPAVSRVALLWPRIDLAKTFMALAENGDWGRAAEACARVLRRGARIEVQQLT